jgi:heme/copper-type cytochrome/quinol oxidase subunit 4
MKVLPRHLPGGTGENYKKEKTSAKIAKIRSEHFPSTSLKHYLMVFVVIVIITIIIVITSTTTHNTNSPE